MNDYIENKIKNTCIIFPELVDDYFNNYNTTIIDLIINDIDLNKVNDSSIDIKKIRKTISRYIITNYDVT